MQLIGDDDDIIACDRNRPGLPVRRLAPQPSLRQAGRRRGDPDDGGSIGAGNRDSDGLGGRCVLRVRHRHRIGERKGLAFGDEIRQKSRKVGETPVDGSSACRGAVGRDRRAERRFERRERSWRYRGSRQYHAGQLGGNRVGIGQIGIDK